MTSILLAAALCVFVPGLFLLLMVWMSPDLPGRTLPPVEPSRWQQSPEDAARPQTEAIRSASGPVGSPTPAPDPDAEQGTGPSGFTRSYRWVNILLLPFFFAFTAAGTALWSY